MRKTNRYTFEGITHAWEVRLITAPDPPEYSIARRPRIRHEVLSANSKMCRILVDAQGFANYAGCKTMVQ